MKIDYRVHTVSEGRANVPAKVDGADVMATVPCVEVELVSLSDRHGNQVFRFAGDQIEEARATFVPDAEITADFTVKAPPAKKKGE